MSQKPPVVVILGHVDHGKTTLLDALRAFRDGTAPQTHPSRATLKLTEKEPGGITQSIGAYEIAVDGKHATFIDTPGHEAFSAMRSYGANAADIALLVVAADDGVKPQTKEALTHIQAAHIPFIVVINKIDVQGADPRRVRSELAQENCMVEGFGGSVPVIEISALHGTNLKDLLELLFLVYDLEEKVSQPDGPLQAVVIESQRDPRIGPLVSVIVQTGTLRRGDQVEGHGVGGSVRALINDRKEKVERVLPGEPAQIMGFTDILPVGTVITRATGASVKSQPTEVSGKQSMLPTTPAPQDQNARVFILKADTWGALEALMRAIPKEGVVVAHSVGDVNESDVLLAETCRATIIGFRTKVSVSVANLAQAHRVQILTHDIIYKLLEALVEREIKTAPAARELGRAKIIKLFEIEKRQIAGCKIVTGRVAVGDPVRLGESELAATATIKELHQGKISVTSVQKDNECGILLLPIGTGTLNLAVGGDIIALQKNEAIR